MSNDNQNEKPVGEPGTEVVEFAGIGDNSGETETVEAEIVTEYDVMSEVEFNDTLGEMVANGATLAQIIHKLGCDALKDAYNKGNANRITRIVTAYPKVARKQGFIAWVHKFSPVYVNGDGEANLLGKKSPRYTEWAINDAVATPFWDCAEAKEVVVADLTVTDLRKAVLRLVALASEADADGNIYNKEGVLVKRIPADERARVAEFSAKLKAIAA